MLSLPSCTNRRAKAHPFTTGSLNMWRPLLRPTSQEKKNGFVSKHYCSLTSTWSPRNFDGDRQRINVSMSTDAASILQPMDTGVTWLLSLIIWELHFIKLLLHAQCVWFFATPPTVATRLLYPWDSPGKNTRVGCHFVFQRILLTLGLSPSSASRSKFLKPLISHGCHRWFLWWIWEKSPESLLQRTHHSNCH